MFNFVYSGLFGVCGAFCVCASFVCFIGLFFGVFLEIMKHVEEGGWQFLQTEFLFFIYISLSPFFILFLNLCKSGLILNVPVKSNSLFSVKEILSFAVILAGAIYVYLILLFFIVLLFLPVYIDMFM